MEYSDIRNGRNPGVGLRTVAWAGVVLFLIASNFSTECRAQTVTFHHPWVHGQAVMQNLAAEYTRQTGVRVQVTALNPQGYNPWTDGVQPDIIGLSYPNRGTIARNAQAGRLSNMSPDLVQAWYADLWPGPVAVFELSGTEAPAGRPGTYGIPLTAFVRVFVYNREMFRRAGVSPPRTWSDFLLASSRIRGIGIVPMAGGVEGTYPAFPLIYERSYLGNHYLLQTYFGRLPYTDTRWRNQFRVYSEMRQYQLTTVGAAQMTRANAQRFLLDGNCAVILDGPWFESMRRTYRPTFTNWGVFGPPDDRRAPFLASAPGGVAEGVVINSRSRNRAAAVRFIRWLTMPAQQVRLANGMGSIPISEQASQSPALASHLRVFTPYMRYAAQDLRYHEDPAVLNRLYQGARNVIGGTETPAQALNATQRLAR